MTKQKHLYFHIFWQLLITDIHIYKSAILNAFIDIIIWFGSTIILFGYVFPFIGLQQSFGPFIAISSIVGCIFWDIWSTATLFISDIKGNKTINYLLTLPIPNYLVLIKQIFGYAIKAGIPSLIVLPLAKLFLWNTLDLSQFSFAKFTIIFILTSFFIGTFSLLITSTVNDIDQLGKVGIRFLFPLWSFSSAFYPWQLVYSLSPKLGYFNLLNPLLYAMEGMRAAILGQSGYLNFWFCSLMIIIFIVFFTWWGIVRLKKQLAFV